MLSQPRKVKFRKQFRGKMRGMSKGSLISFGDYGLKCLTCKWVTPNQIEAGRRAIAHNTKRKAKIWIRIFTDKPITEKGAGAPLGAGKGDVKGYVAVVKPGRIIYEISGIPKDIAYRALEIAGSKLPFKTKIIERQ